MIKVTAHVTHRAPGASHGSITQLTYYLDEDRNAMAIVDWAEQKHNRKGGNGHVSIRVEPLPAMSLSDITHSIDRVVGK